MSLKGKTNKNQTKAPKYISCSNRRGKEKEAAPGQSAKGAETDTPEAGNPGPASFSAERPELEERTLCLDSPESRRIDSRLYTSENVF